jgi:hypothetical protein
VRITVITLGLLGELGEVDILFVSRHFEDRVITIKNMLVVGIRVLRLCL